MNRRRPPAELPGDSTLAHRRDRACPHRSPATAPPGSPPRRPRSSPRPWPPDCSTRARCARVEPPRGGPKSMPDYAALRDQAVTPIQGGAKAYVGQADDPFFLDLRVFDLRYGADLSEVGQDTLRGFNANTIALQVPKAWLASKKRWRSPTALSTGWRGVPVPPGRDPGRAGT
ncbi:DUF4331 family protein [Saccharothrix hoggarensis]|uniref:DUF4331 family protein n=1 Tax=Saccharothrix hoggarensis TaxID=913853 RepID=A0ABW3QPI7_9PSEU